LNRIIESIPFSLLIYNDKLISLVAGLRPDVSSTPIQCTEKKGLSPALFPSRKKLF
jgi:hypothetical protein